MWECFQFRELRQHDIRKDLSPPVEVNTNVRPHVLRADTEHFLRLHSLGVGPLGDHVVYDPLGEVARDLVEDHELPHPVQHLVVLGRGQRHVVDDGGHVTEDGRVQKTRHCHTQAHGQ